MAGGAPATPSCSRTRQEKTSSGGQLCQNSPSGLVQLCARCGRGRKGEGARPEERPTVPAPPSAAELIASSSQHGTQHHPEHLWDTLPAPSPLGNASGTGPGAHPPPQHCSGLALPPKASLLSLLFLLPWLAACLFSLLVLLLKAFLKALCKAKRVISAGSILSVFINREEKKMPWQNAEARHFQRDGFKGAGNGHLCKLCHPFLSHVTPF